MAMELGMDPCSSPIRHQGHHDNPSAHNISKSQSLHQLDSLVTEPRTPHDATESPTSTTSTVTSTTLANRRQDRAILASDTGSPTKHQSPLRQSISFNPPAGTSPPCVFTSEGPLHPQAPKCETSMMAYTGDSRRVSRRESSLAQQQQQQQELGTTSYAHGEDGPVSNSAQTKPLHSDDVTPTKLNAEQSRSPSSTPNIASPASAASKSGFWASSMSALRGIRPATIAPLSHNAGDELACLDIEAALFPQGNPSDRDTFSPAAYKNLHMTATGLLQRFQSVYRQRTAQLQEIKSERDAQADEKEEAETRIRHLKMQLEGMARRAAEQEAVMQDLMNELSQEKRLRMEERLGSRNASTSSGTSAVSEDLDAEGDQQQQKKKWRRSGGTTKSDFSLDTDQESFEEASIFSQRSCSPTIATTISEFTPSPIDTPTLQSRAATQRQPQQPQQRPSLPHITTIQRLFKGNQADPEGRTVASCRNCQGQDASMAWDTASLLRGENRGLKDRVGELETAVEKALDAVHGLGL